METHTKPTGDELTELAAEAATARARISTDKGDIVFTFYPDVAPQHSAAFIKLARAGFYDGLTFHRVEPGFVIQGGDPSGNGTGGPGYQLDAEFNENPHITGTVAMARSFEPELGRVAVLHLSRRRAVPQPAVHRLRPRGRRSDGRRRDPQGRRDDDGDDRGQARLAVAGDAAASRCRCAARTRRPRRTRVPDTPDRASGCTSTYGASLNGSTIAASLRTVSSSPVLLAIGTCRLTPAGIISR